MHEGQLSIYKLDNFFWFSKEKKKNKIMSYTFENMSRIGGDSTSQDQNTIQNMNSCNYLLQNYTLNDTGMSTPIALATTQPGVFYQSQTNVGTSGCKVDESSQLLYGGILAHPRNKLDLFQRPFATIPYLGRGSVSTVLESQMLQGETFTNKRTVNKIMEKNFSSYQQTPLLPDIKNRVTNPTFCIEESCTDGWIRGGLASREMTRDGNSKYQYK